MQLLHHKSVWSCTKSSKAGKQWIYNHMLINMQLCRIITDLQTSLSSELCKHILHRLPSLFEIWEYRSPRRAGVSSEIKPALCTPSVSLVFVLQYTTFRVNNLIELCIAITITEQLLKMHYPFTINTYALYKEKLAEACLHVCHLLSLKWNMAPHIAIILGRFMCWMLCAKFLPLPARSLRD